MTNQNQTEPLAPFRQLTPQERSVLSTMPAMLSEMQDILMDLTMEPTSNLQLRSRMRQMAARLLLRDLEVSIQAINAIFTSAPVLAGSITDNETAE